MAKKPKEQKTPLQRSIESRERGIKRMLDEKVKIMDEAKRKCDEIDKRLVEKKVLLDALKKGSIQP